MVYIDTKSIFEEAGWECALDSWYPNSQYYIWKPKDISTTDIYISDSYHNAGGYTLVFTWADSFEHAKKLFEDAKSIMPSFTITTKEELLVLIKCIKG